MTYHQINTFTPLKKGKFIHGESCHAANTPEYAAYLTARARCNNPRLKNYHRYGGRGIEFRFATYEEWLTEVGRKPTPEHSLDRIDNDGHYEKGNVKWSTKKEQNRNRRDNRMLQFRGELKCLADWCDSLNIKRNTVCSRLQRGWSIERALTT